MLSDADIRWIVNEVVQACQPSQVYVFGSHALGAAHARSDLDLLIIQQSREPRQRLRAGLLGKLSRIAVDIDLVFLTPEELRYELTHTMSLASAILPSARLVYSDGAAVPDHGPATNPAASTRI